jgi:hypothetical protein
MLQRRNAPTIGKSGGTQTTPWSVHTAMCKSSASAEKNSSAGRHSLFLNAWVLKGAVVECLKGGLATMYGSTSKRLC